MKTAEEIISEEFSKLRANIKFQIIGLGKEFDEACYRAMKEYTKQAIEHCADVADADYNVINNVFSSDDIEVYVLKNSILDVIKELK